MGADLDEKSFSKALARLLEGQPDAVIAAERAKWQALPGTTRDIVATRVRVIDRFLAKKGPSLADADRAVGELGMKRRNFYRLIARMREFGPVTGLAPNARGRQPASAARDGLHPTAEAAIGEVLDTMPDAPLSVVMDAIEAAFVQDEPEEARPPSLELVRRRLGELRKPGGERDRRVAASGRTFGRRVLIDQCAVASPVYDVDGEVVLSFILDVETRLVIGCGQATVDNLAIGLDHAAQHALRSAASFAVGPFALVARPTQVVWVLPDGIEADGDAWGQLQEGDVRKLDPAGDRRHGRRLVEILGIAFDAFQLMPRATSGWRRGDKAVRGPAPDLSSDIVDAVDRWNYRVLEGASGLPPTLDPTEQQQRLKTWRASHSKAKVRRTIEGVAVPLLSVSKKPKRAAGLDEADTA